MSKLFADISVSLDGYIAAPGRTQDEPMGRNGELLHEWISSAQGQELLAEAGTSMGAIITGRRTYDDSLR